MLTPSFPDGIDMQVFLRDYWQKKPLLIRGALDSFSCQLDPNELAGLACEEGVESRLVLEKGGKSPWEVKYGPFDEADFSALPPSHWTLLVQDVDKFIPQVTRLLDYFRFIPDWRIDDVMISYAEDQGSVGPHVDDYDVFLYQAAGRRRWRIHQQPVAEDDYISGLELRILPSFETEQEWLLEPGDCLYLPPNVAHWGVAEGESVTCSVGFRAPSIRDMFADWCEDLAYSEVTQSRYRDGPLTPQLTPGEILPDVTEALAKQFSEYLRQDPEQLRRWFGRYISRTKGNLVVDPPEWSGQLQDDLQDPALSVKELSNFINHFRESGVIQRNLLSRMSFSKGTRGEDSLFVNGEEYTLPSLHGGILAAITHYRELHFGYLEPWMEPQACRELLYRLYLDGHLEFAEDAPFVPDAI